MVPFRPSLWPGGERASTQQRHELLARAPTFARRAEAGAGQELLSAAKREQAAHHQAEGRAPCATWSVGASGES